MELIATVNNSSVIGLRPNQETDNFYLAGCQNFYGPITAVCIPLSLSLDASVCSGYPMPIPKLHVERLKAEDK